MFFVCSVYSSIYCSRSNGIEIGVYRRSILSFFTVFFGYISLEPYTAPWVPAQLAAISIYPLLRPACCVLPHVVVDSSLSLSEQDCAPSRLLEDLFAFIFILESWVRAERDLRKKCVMSVAVTLENHSQKRQND